MSSDPTEALLRGHGLRVTPQRRAVLEAFRGADDEHLSAERVASRAGMSVPNIGRGTVYAILAELTEIGVLASVGSSDPIRFETNVAAHDHFGCRLCLRMFDVKLGGRELRRRRLKGYRIEAISVTAEGICADCTAYHEGLRDGAAAARSVQTLPEASLDALSCVVTDSALGELALVASAEGIVHLAFNDHADFEMLIARAGSRRGAAAARARLPALATSIENYLAGNRAPFGDVVDWRLLSEHQQSALTRVQQIPFASLCSYQRLPVELGPYGLGHLMGVNPLPLLIPCHRVTRGTEPPDAYVGGAERLRFLQGLEHD